MKYRTGTFPAEGLTEALGALVRIGTQGEASDRGLAPAIYRARTTGRDALEWQSRSILEVLPVAIYTTDADGRLTFFNSAAVTFAGRRPHLGVDEWCVTWRLYQPDGAFLPHEQCPMAVALKERRLVRGVEAIAERPDGTRVPFRPHPTPLRDESGRIIGAVNMLVETSCCKEAQARGYFSLAGSDDAGLGEVNLLQGLLSLAYQGAHGAKARVILSEASRRVGSLLAAQRILHQFPGAPDYDPAALVAAVGASAGEWSRQRPLMISGRTSRRLAADTAIPLALILGELIATATRHAADRAAEGTIKVELRDAPGALELRLEDTARDLRLSGSGPRSSGLGPVMGLARQIGARLDVDSVAARWIVRFHGEDAATGSCAGEIVTGAC